MHFSTGKHWLYDLVCRWRVWGEVWLAGQKDYAPVWLAAFFAAGIGVYFTLSFEPSGKFITISACLSLAAAILFALTGSAIGRWAAFAGFLMCAGFMAGQARTQSFDPAIKREMGPMTLNASVHEVQDIDSTSGKARRLVLKDIKAEGDYLSSARIRVHDGTHLLPGDRINVTAKLMPPAGPSLPGGFDFQRYAYFQGWQAVGFAFDTPEVVHRPDAAQHSLQGFRQRLKEDVGVWAAEASTGAVGMTILFLTGAKDAVPESARKAMRDSGLAHMLAISGLHVGLIAGCAFFMLRLAFVVIPGAALRYPIKKWAALAGIVTACLYLLLVGPTIPTQRAVIMTSIAFFAIMLDRSPLSLRLLAVAALLVLLFRPEALFGASFQMSFAAVAGLIIFYDWTAPFWQRWRQHKGIVSKCSMYLAGLSATSLVATLTTAPFVIYHFQSWPVYSIIANLAAVPVLAFIVMPAVLFAFLLMPFGLAAWPVKCAVLGAEFIIYVAESVSAWPEAVLHVPALSHLSLMAVIVGGLLWAVSGIRFWPLFMMILLACGTYELVKPKPVFLVNANGALAGVYEGERFLLSSTSKERYAAEQWQQYFATYDFEAWPEEGRRGSVSCDNTACRVHVRELKIAWLKKPQSVRAECIWAEIIFEGKHIKSGTACNGKEIIALRRQPYGLGALAVYEDGRIVSDAEIRGVRPWTPYRR